MNSGPPRTLSRRRIQEAGLLSRRFTSRGLPFSVDDVRHTMDNGAEIHWVQPSNGAVLLAPYTTRHKRDVPVGEQSGLLAIIAMGNVELPEDDDLAPQMRFAHRQPESPLVGGHEAEQALLHYVDALVHERDPTLYFAEWNRLANGEFVAGQALYELLHRLVHAYLQEFLETARAIERRHRVSCAYVVPPLPLSRRVSEPVARAATLLWGHVLDAAFRPHGRGVSQERLRLVTATSDLDFPILVHDVVRQAGLHVAALTQTADTIVPDGDSGIALFEHGLIPRDVDPTSVAPDALSGLVWLHDGEDDDAFESLPPLSLAAAMRAGRDSRQGDPAPPRPPLAATRPPSPMPRPPRVPTATPVSLHDAKTVIREGPPSDELADHARNSHAPAQAPEDRPVRPPSRPKDPSAGRPPPPQPVPRPSVDRSDPSDPGSIEIPRDIGAARFERHSWWRKLFGK